MSDALPAEVLDFLVRSLPSRELWAWLNEENQSHLRARITQGFRASHETLRQPVARARLISHLQNSSIHSGALLKLWGHSAPGVLAAIRERDDETLISQLPALQSVHGTETLVLALLHDEREAALEAWTEQSAGESSEESEFAPPDSGILAPDEQSLKAASLDTASLDAASLQKQLHRSREKIETLRAKAQDAKSRASQTEKLLKEKLREQERLTREAQRDARQYELRSDHLQEKLAATEQARERAERKAKSTQAENETANAELKTLRRQVHRLQRINEELRRDLMALKSKREDDKTGKEESVKGEASKIKEGSASGESTKNPELDFPAHLPALPYSRFNNNAATEKIKVAIDRNDEIFVATLREELSALRERDATAYKELLKRVREMGRAYEKVLTMPTARVLVDASNVARHDAKKKGRLAYLWAMREELRAHQFFPILFIADASLPHFIDQPKQLRQLIEQGEVHITLTGQQADEVLARQARETGAYVVTNDRNFHFAFAPDFAPSRIGFRIEDGVVILDDF